MSELVEAFKRAWENPPQGPSLIGMAKKAWGGITAPGDALSGKMPVFDPETGHVSQEAVERGADLASTVAGTGAPLPRQGTLGVFGGMAAKTADKQQLARAQRLEEMGAPRDAIWRDTGWGRGLEGRWMFEIPDNNMKARPGTGSDISNPNSALFHLEFAAAYPREARDLSFNLAHNPMERGSFNPYSRVLMAQGPKSGIINLRGVTAHEINHLGQTIEGFAPGGNQKEAGHQIMRAAAVRRGEIPPANIEPWAAELDRKLLQEKGDPNDFIDAAYDAYRRHAGEMMSRNAQHYRIDLTPEERRLLPPWQTLDRPEKDAIVRKPIFAPPLP